MIDGIVRSGVCLGVVVCLCAGFAWGHSDDPKVLDQMPRSERASFRAAEGGAAEGIGGGASGVVLRANITLPEFGQSAGNDLWGYTSVSGREYAIMGLRAATSFVEVTDPSNPQIIETISGPGSIWRDVKTYQTYAYSVSEGGGGIQVFDLSQIDQGVVTLVNQVLTGGVSSTHNIVVDEVSGYLYRCAGADNVGLRVYDLSDPAAPVFVGQWMDRYVHDAEVRTFTDGPWAGRQIAFCCAGFNGGETQTGLDIVDVTDKSNMFLVSRLLYPQAAYSHQGTLTEDGKYFLLNDELDEASLGKPSTTIVIDVSDINNPAYAGEFTNGDPAITHNTYIRDGLMYAANYTSGMRIFDVRDPLNAEEIAFYDTSPSSGTTFNSLWSVYPHFESGTLIGSDIEQGLWVWEAVLPGISIASVGPEGDLISPSSPVITAEVGEGFGTAGFESGTAVLWYRFGGSGAFASVSMTEGAGGLLEAEIPAGSCGETVEFYVEAQDTDGVAVTAPAGAPGSVFTRRFAENEAAGFADDMETDTGWIAGVAGDTATTGVWERIDPVATLGQPEEDHTEGGSFAWFTGQHDPAQPGGFNDVDGGFTTLVSPVLDATAEPGEAFLTYHRWYSNDTGGSPGADEMPVDISNDDGQSWTRLETVTESPGRWERKVWRVSDVLTPTSQMRLRFVAQDLGSPSIVEAGVDDVSIGFVDCNAPVACDGDADGNGVVDVNDLTAVVNALGSSGGGADVDGSGVVDVNDLTFVVNRLGAGCG